MPDPDTYNAFIGRARELAIYKAWLMDPTAPNILYFYDSASDHEHDYDSAIEHEHDKNPRRQKKGGVGKTRLLQQCRNFTETHHPDITIVVVDFFNITDRNGIAIAERVYQQLKAAYPNWPARAFGDLLEAHEQEDIKDDSSQLEIRSKLAEALAADLHRLNIYLHKTRRRLLLFLDTFEVIQDNPAIAVLSPMQSFPDTYHFSHISFVIAGRDALNWTHPNWQKREHEVRSVALEPFNFQEMVEYMNSRYIPLEAHSPHAAALNELTGGRPILLGLVADVVNRGILQLERLLTVPVHQFEEYLVTKINDIRSPENWVLLFMAHAYHRFNFSLLEWILHETSLRELVGEVDYAQLLRTLPELSFVRRATNGDDFVLHDEMRPLVNTYCWERQDPDKSYRQAVSEHVIEYYEQAYAQERNELMRQTYTVEILYHTLFLDVNEGLRYFNTHFDKAINLWLNAYASSLLQETHKLDYLLTPIQHFDLSMADARLFVRNGQPENALLNYETLYKEADKDWVEAHKAAIFYGFGECYLDMTDFDKAIYWLKEALALERAYDNQERCASILDLLGYISRRQGKLETAAAHYQASIDIYKALGNLREYAYVLNSLGNVYRQLGKIDDAFTVCKISLRHRETLFRRNEGSETAIGLSHATIGAIYLHSNDIFQAEQHFNQAFEIFVRTNHKTGLARIHNRFGQIHMAQGNLSAAMAEFEKAQEAAARIHNKEAQINSFNKQGRVYARRSHYTNARNAFEQAIELARNTRDFYQEAESKIDLAPVLTNLGEHELSKQVLAEGYAIARHYDYYYLLGTAELFEGNLHYQRQERKESFVHYGKACHFMALYNPLEFQRTLQTLIDRLLDLDTPGEIQAALTELRAYWEKQKLIRKFPDFLHACDKVHKLVQVEESGSV